MTLFQKLLWWLREQPDQNAPGMTDETWKAFIDSIGAVLFVGVLVTIVVAVIGYAIHARRLGITHADHYFRSFGPLRWPWLLAFTPAAIVMWRFITEYHARFPQTLINPLGSAVQSAIWAWLVSYVGARLLVMLPGITPAKFRYRPLRPFVPSGALTARGGAA